MRTYRLACVVLFGLLVYSGTVARSVAMPVAKDVGAVAHNSIIDVRAGRGGGGGRGHAARAGGGRANAARSGSVNRANVSTRRTTNVNASRRTNVNVNRRTNVNVNRNVNVVGRRPVRGWVARPYYGTIVGGVALGTMIAVTAGAVPAAPAANMCWFWADSAQVNGYWDYCAAP
jgi:hypothetical protein